MDSMAKTILLTITPNKDASTTSTYTLSIPSSYTISQLRTYLQNKLFPHDSQETSFFLFAYGCILNNQEIIANIYEKFKDHVMGNKTLEIKYAEMSSFGA